MKKEQPDVQTQKGAGDETVFELLINFFTPVILPRITFCA
jgi:hypothetical protein